jgi:hypothetical protein
VADETRLEKLLDAYDAGRLGRRALLRGLGLAAGGLALAGGAASAEAHRAASSGTLNVRWIGGGVVEVATPDNKQLAYIDAAVWSPTIGSYDIFKIPRPPEFSSPERYHPDVALVGVGDGATTMGPRDAALACQMIGVSHATPIHYGHNPLVLGPEAAGQFQQSVSEIAPGVAVTTMPPGEARSITV